MIKKIVLSSLVCVVILTHLASCKKDYSCKCTYANGANTATTEYVYTDEYVFIENKGKNQAVYEKTCKASEIEARGGEPGKWSCEITEVKK